MNLQKLPIGTIAVANNTRIIIVGYNKNEPNSYIICTCNEQEIATKNLYTLPHQQIEKVLSLGYVESNGNTNINNNSNTNGVVANPQANPNAKSKYIFDQNGFVIGEN